MATRDALAAFCAASARDDDATSLADDVALAEIARAIADGARAVLDVVVDLEGFLTATEPKPRARATEILAHVAEECAMTLDDRAVRTLSAFFASRLSDFASTASAARGAEALVKRANAEAIEATSRALFAECDVQGLRQSDREACVRLAIEMLRSAHAGACARGAGDGEPNEALARIIGAFDGEKDPRCVLGLCEVWTLLPGAFERFGEGGKAVYEENAEELYDVAASYFPVSFKPPRGDSIKISRRQLAEAVERAMTASPTFAPWAVAHALESLNPELGPGKMADAARAVRAMGERFGASVMEEYMGIVWQAMRAALAHPNATKMEEDDDVQATTPMAVMTTMFASEFTRGALARAALTDQCVRDAEVTLRRMANDSSSDDVDGACAMETSDEGCCGGGCGGGSKSSGEEAARGKLVVATASRVLGAVAAATPTLAHEVIHGTLKSLLDAAKIPREIDGLHSSKAAYLALILATPALGGALDCCERNAESSVHMSVLDDESERLVGLFADAALGKIESPSFDEGIVLGLAGLHMLCKFPYRFGLASAESRVAVASKLFDAMMAQHVNESEADIEVRIERSIDALVAAASGADAKLVDAMSTGAVARLADKVTVTNLQTVEATRAIRALCALAAVNQMIRNDVARLFCGVVRDAIEIGSPNAEDLVSAMCRDDDGVLTRFVSSDEAQRACADLTTFCLARDPATTAESTVRVVASAVANCDDATQARFAAEAVALSREKPLMACAVICGLRPQAAFEATHMVAALDELTRSRGDRGFSMFVAAAVGSATHKFPSVDFAPPMEDLTDERTTFVLGACLRARAMRRDDSSPSDALVSCLVRALDDSSSPEASRGAAMALSMAVGFSAAHRDIGLGLKSSTHASEKFLACQRFFTKVAPTLIKGAYEAVGAKRLSRSYAVVKLASGVAPSVALSSQFNLFPLLPDVLHALTVGTLAGDDDAVRAALLLVGARLAEPALYDAGSEGATEQNAVALIDALCAIATATSTMSMECREHALDALVAASTLKFSAVYPSRRRALDAAVVACDDPKRRVRRAAARARQVWLKLMTST